MQSTHFMTVNDTSKTVAFNVWADTATRSRRIRRPTTVYVEKIKIPPSRDDCNSTIIIRLNHNQMMKMIMRLACQDIVGSL